MPDLTATAADGLHAAVTALAWLAGASLPLLAIAGACALAAPVAREARRRRFARRRRYGGR